MLPVKPRQLTQFKLYAHFLEARDMICGNRIFACSRPPLESNIDQVATVSPTRVRRRREPRIRAALDFAFPLELWPSQAVVRICDAVYYCARAAGRAGVVLSPSRAQTRTLGRDFAATAVWNRVSITPVAIPAANAERSGVVCRGDVSWLFVREVQLSNAAPSS